MQVNTIRFAAAARQCGASCAMALLLGLACLSAQAAELITNGGFETNGGASSTSLSGWTIATQAGSQGSFYAQTGEFGPITGFAVPAPPLGNFAAMSDSLGIGSHALYQDVAIPAGATALFSMRIFVLNRALEYHAPDSLDYTVIPNQQARVDIVKPTADVFSTEPSDVLLNLFHAKEGSAQQIGYQELSADLSAFAGQTIRIRIANALNQQGLQVGVDGLSLDANVDPGATALSLALFSGTPQSTPLNTPWTAPLQAVVRDNSGNPVANASVTFTLPASGPSGSFPGGLLTFTGTTDSNGVVTTPLITANGNPGDLVVTATTPGVATPLSFNLTITPAVAISGVDPIPALSPGLLALLVGLLGGLGGWLQRHVPRRRKPV